MAAFKIYKLHFTSPLHIGDRHVDDGNSLKSIQSDTLYAAITACLAKTGYSIPPDGDLGFTVSSLFPYYQREKGDCPVFFLPMPMKARQPRISETAMAKKVKKIQWVDACLYGSILAGDSLFDGSDRYLPCIQETYLTTVQLAEDANHSREFVCSEVMQRVELRSRTGEEDAVPYYVDRILFRYESGFYFIAEGDTSLLEKALGILSVEGIGTDRNVGFGFFEFTTDTLTIDLPAKANHQLALSLLIPESRGQLAELMGSDCVAYDFARRGGWINTYPYATLHKNAIYGFLPGSVFWLKEGNPCRTIGKIVSLKPQLGELMPDHDVFRNGRAVMLPVYVKPNR